jgi:hypothetical protein
MITWKEKRDFITSVFDDSILSLVITWISSNVKPEDVYCNTTLEAWALENGYAKKE